VAQRGTKQPLLRVGPISRATVHVEVQQVRRVGGARGTSGGPAEANGPALTGLDIPAHQLSVDVAGAAAVLGAVPAVEIDQLTVVTCTGRGASVVNMLGRILRHRVDAVRR